MFADALAEAGMRVRVVNPNERAVDDLFGTRSMTQGAAIHREVDVEFVTRYAIPAATVEALTWFLSEISRRTVAAMKNFVRHPRAVLIASRRNASFQLVISNGRIGYSGSVNSPSTRQNGDSA